MEIKVTIEAPELAKAINNLAAALSKVEIAKPVESKISPAPKPIENATVPAPKTVESKSAEPIKQAESIPPAIAAPTTKPIAAVPVTAVPVAEAPQYTVKQLMDAGAVLLDAGKINDLKNLLSSFGVEAVTHLKPEQFGAFATGLRKLGAEI